MREMKRNTLLSLVMAVVLVSLTTACKKDQDVVTLKATSENFRGTNSKVYINDNLYAVWEAGDAVGINGQLNLAVASGDDYTISGVNNVATYYAFYPANYVSDRQTAAVAGTTNILMPVNQTYTFADGVQHVKTPMVASYSASSADAPATLAFRNVANLLKLEVPALNGYAITFIEVESNNSPLSGEFTVSSGISTLSNGDGVSMAPTSGGTTSQVVGLDCWNNAQGYASGTFYVVLPPVSNSKLTISVYMQSTADHKVYKYSKQSTSAVTVTRNTILPASFDFNVSGVTSAQVYEYPDHTSVGIFHVSATKNVRFTKGNLYNTVGDNIFGSWHMEAEQYEYRTYQGYRDYYGGYAHMQSNENHFGLFRLSTNATGNKFGMYLGDGDECLGDFVDWGMNSIDNNESNYFRTLTIQEWDYLITHHAYAIGRCSGGGLASIRAYGFFLFPNGAPSNISNVNKPGISYLNQAVPEQGDYNDNQITNLSVWSSIEQTGCIYLPALGHGFISNGSLKPTDNSQTGHYWSSTLETLGSVSLDPGDDNPDPTKSYRFYWYYTHVCPMNFDPRSFGRCVRLVVD